MNNQVAPNDVNNGMKNRANKQDGNQAHAAIQGVVAVFAMLLKYLSVYIPIAFPFAGTRIADVASMSF